LLQKEAPMPDPNDAPVPPRIEELDPARPAGPGRHWELALALVLLLGLAGFGGWQWWQSSTRLAFYRAGTAAGAARDWDAAYRAYTQAEGYEDAEARARDAAAKRTERDTQYQLATAARAQGRSPAALAAIRRVLAIAPTYRDSAQLGAALQAEVYTAALSGAIALRPQATPPGLYAYGSQGWQALAGSDPQSRVFAVCPDGAVLFDVPGGETVPLPLPPPQVYPGATLSSLRGRRLVVAIPGARPRATPALDPSQFESFGCTEMGVWGVNAANDASQIIGAYGLLQAEHTAYQAFDDPAPHIPALPGPAWYVLSVAPDGRHIALIDTATLVPDHWRARIYLANADGSARRLVFDGPGVPGYTPFSPDGRYLMLDLQHATSGAGVGRHTIQVVDTTGTAPPRILADVPQDGGLAALGPRVLARFVQRGGHDPELLAVLPEANGQRILLFNIAHPDRRPVSYLTSADPGLLLFWNTSGPAGGLVLAWQTWLPDSTPHTGTILYMGNDNQVRRAAFTLPGDTGITHAIVRSDRLLVATALNQFNPEDPRWEQTLSSRPLPPLPGPTVDNLYTGTQSTQAPGQSWYLGPGLLAYTTLSGDLYARSYDGSADVPLESGVRSFSPLDLTTRR
jgi:hypothetical protein